MGIICSGDIIIIPTILVALRRTWANIAYMRRKRSKISNKIDDKD